MTRRVVPIEFADRLASQEQALSDERLAKHWRDLDERVSAIARRERWARFVVMSLGWLTLAGILAFLMAAAIWPGTYPLRLLLDGFSEPVAAIVATIIFAVPVCLVILMFTYFVNHRRRLRQAEHEQVIAMLTELDRQISDLRRHLGRNSE